jgi:hypothetical protein
LPQQLTVKVSIGLSLFFISLLFLKSIADLPYLQDIFVFKYRDRNDRFGTIESALEAIIEIDRGSGIALAIEDAIV